MNAFQLLSKINFTCLIFNFVFVNILRQKACRTWILLFISSLIIATPFFRPPAVYAYPAGVNLNDYRLDPVDPANYRGLDRYDVDHPIDSAPQLKTMIVGNPKPDITSLYIIQPLPGESNSAWADKKYPGAVTATGLRVSPGQVIQVPKYAREISTGYQVFVLYADSNNITLKYTCEDDIVYGYTLHIRNLNVNPEILSLYNQGDAAGRVEMPILSAFQPIGTAAGDELIIAIRDTGAFMDPRWTTDWWVESSSPTSPQPPQLFDFTKCAGNREEDKGEYGPETVCKINGHGAPMGIFRPQPCLNCSLDVKLPIRTCAFTPKVVQYQDFTCDDVTSCNGKNVAYLDWAEVTFNLNTEVSKVPFAGYRNACRTDLDIRANDSKSCVTDEESDPANMLRANNPNDYINDYFEGTALFDKRDFDMTDLEDTRDIFWEYGVFRKLAAAELQDNYRKEMIVDRGFDYEVDGIVYTIGPNGERSNPHLIEPPLTMQDWAKPSPCAFLGDINTCKFPPESKGKTSTEYAKLVNDWLKTEYGQLWYHIPLFSREDAPGKAILTVEHVPGTIDPGKSNSKVEIPLAIPHLTRLYESTNALYSLLTPTMEDAMDQQTYLPRFDQNQTSNQPEKTPLLLAQAAVSDISEPKILALLPPEQCYDLSAASNVQDNGGGNFTVSITLILYSPEGGGDGHINCLAGYDPGCSLSQEPWNKGVNNPFTVEPEHTGGSFTVSKGNPVIRSFGVSVDACGGATGQDKVEKSITCTYTVDENNKLITNCTASGNPGPPPDPCTVGSNINSICKDNNPVTDPHPNDAICCDNKAKVNVDDYIYDGFEDQGGDALEFVQSIEPCPVDEFGRKIIVRYTARMSRRVEVKLDIPYLKDVYEKTAGPDMSIFNLFKSAEKPDYPDYDGQSYLAYEISSGEERSYVDYYQKRIEDIKNKAYRGELFLPYLGGIHMAKKCVSEQVLIPTALLPTYNQCQFWGGSLLNNTGTSAESTADE